MKFERFTDSNEQTTRMCRNSKCHLRRLTAARVSGRLAHNFHRIFLSTSSPIDGEFLCSTQCHATRWSSLSIKSPYAFLRSAASAHRTAPSILSITKSRHNENVCRLHWNFIRMTLYNSRILGLHRSVGNGKHAQHTNARTAERLRTQLMNSTDRNFAGPFYLFYSFSPASAIVCRKRGSPPFFLFSCASVLFVNGQGNVI